MENLATANNFPAFYNENYLILLVRDTHCIFAYWELTRDQMQLVANGFEGEWGKVPLTLRLYDLTGLNFNGQNAHGYYDISVNPLADNYFVKEIKANHSYCIDLGVVVSEDRFITLLRSNLVKTPRDSRADGSETVTWNLLDLSIDKKSDVLIESFSSDGVYATTGILYDSNNQ